MIGLVPYRERNDMNFYTQGTQDALLKLGFFKVAEGEEGSSGGAAALRGAAIGAPLGALGGLHTVPGAHLFSHRMPGVNTGSRVGLGAGLGLGLGGLAGYMAGHPDDAEGEDTSMIGPTGTGLLLGGTTGAAAGAATPAVLEALANSIPPFGRGPRKIIKGKMPKFMDPRLSGALTGGGLGMLAGGGLGSIVEGTPAAMDDKTAAAEEGEGEEGGPYGGRRGRTLGGAALGASGGALAGGFAGPGPRGLMLPGAALGALGGGLAGYMSGEPEGEIAQMLGRAGLTGAGFSGGVIPGSLAGLTLAGRGVGRRPSGAEAMKMLTGAGAGALTGSALGGLGGYALGAPPEDGE